jgi:hypothetical protein
MRFPFNRLYDFEQEIFDFANFPTYYSVTDKT